MDSSLFGTDIKQQRRPDKTHQFFGISTLDILVCRDNLTDLGSDRIELKYFIWEYSTSVKIRAASDFSKRNILRKNWCPHSSHYRYYSLLDVTSYSTSEICRSFGKVLLLPPAAIKSKQRVHPYICKFVPGCSAFYFRRWKSQPYWTMNFCRRSNQVSAHKILENNDTERTCLIYKFDVILTVHRR